MTLITLAIAILLVLAINGHKSTSSTATTTSSSSSAEIMAHSSSVSEETAYDKFKTKFDGYNANGLTVTQKQKLQTLINNEDNSAVQDREQKLLDGATVKPAKTQSSSAESSSHKPDNQDNTSTFATTHTFSSVGDAQNWAQASKNQWLQAGYSTYTITSDGQGNYNLQFVR